MTDWQGGRKRDFWMEEAIREIRNNYGVIARPKPKSLLKFGQAASLGTSLETIWQRGGDETYLTGNVIDTISSSNAGDVQDVTIEGHTDDGSGNLTFVAQSVTLDGQNKVLLATPMARANRIFNNDNTDFAGTVYAYEDDTLSGGVPTTTAKIHLQSTGSNNQSLKAATSISSVDFWVITQVYAAVNKKTPAVVDFDFQVREKGKVFRTRFNITAASDGPNSSIPMRPYLVIPPNSDFRFRGQSSAANTECTAWANGKLLLVG